MPFEGQTPNMVGEGGGGVEEGLMDPDNENWVKGMSRRKTGDLAANCFFIF